MIKNYKTIEAFNPVVTVAMNIVFKKIFQPTQKKSRRSNTATAFVVGVRMRD